MIKWLNKFSILVIFRYQNYLWTSIFDENEKQSPCTYPTGQLTCDTRRYRPKRCQSKVARERTQRKRNDSPSLYCYRCAMQFITNNLFKKSTLGFFIFWTNLTSKIILQSLPKRKRKWINLTWTFKAAPSVNKCFKSIKCKPQHYKKIFKKKKKNPQKNSSIIFVSCTTTSIHTCYSVCTQKSERKAIFDSKYTINADC